MQLGCGTYTGLISESFSSIIRVILSCPRARSRNTRRADHRSALRGGRALPGGGCPEELGGAETDRLLVPTILEIQPCATTPYAPAGSEKRGRPQVEEWERNFGSSTGRWWAPGQGTGQAGVRHRGCPLLKPSDEQSTGIILLDSKGFEDCDGEACAIYFKTDRTRDAWRKFAYLGEEDCRKGGITDPNRIADWCERMIHCPGALCTQAGDSDKELESCL